MRIFFTIYDTNNSKISISYLVLEDVYQIHKNYIFCIPDVSTVCECACTTKDQNYCSYNSGDKEMQCARFSNLTTTCTPYDAFGKDSKVCSTYYRICCQTYFSKNVMLKRYNSFKLKYHRSNYKFEINLLLLSGEKNITLQVDGTIKYLILTPELLLNITFMTPNHFLLNNRFFIEEGSRELFFLENINEREGENLDKLGWFQFNEKNKHPYRVRLNDLKNRLKVKPLNCNPVSPKLEWTLHAIGYSSEGIVRWPKDIRKLSEMYKGLISKNAPKYNESVIIFEMLNSPTVKFSIFNTSSYAFIFTSTISFIQNLYPVLNLTFQKGNSSFFVEVYNFHTTDVHKFAISFINASPDNMITVTEYLPFQKDISNVVCVYQNDHQLCQKPEIITTNTDAVKTKEASTTLFSEYYTELEPDRNTTYQEEFTENLWEIYFPSVLIPLIILIISAIIFYKYRRKLKKRIYGETYNVMDETENLHDYDLENNFPLEVTNVPDNVTGVVDNNSTLGNRLEKAINIICPKLSKEYYKPLARVLALSDETMDEIEHSCALNDYGDEAILQGALQEWKKENGTKATFEDLTSALNKINKESIVEEIYNIFFLEMENEQKNIYRHKEFPECLKLKMPLEEIFEDITFCSENHLSHRNEKMLDKAYIFEGLDKVKNPLLLFVDDQQDNEQESMLAEKFLYDWSKGAKYICNKFDLVFFKSLNSNSGKDLDEWERITGTEKEILRITKSLKKRVLIFVIELGETSPIDWSHPLSIREEFTDVTIVVISKSDNLIIEKRCEVLNNLNTKSIVKWNKHIRFKRKSISKYH